MAGARRAAKEGKSVQKFFIVTNKALDTDVASWIRTGKLADSQRTWIASSILRNQKSSAGKRTLATIKDEIDAVMQRFHPTVASWTLQKCRDKISDYGRRFGLDDRQIHQGVERLTGRLTFAGGQGISDPINQAVLNEALTWIDDPCELTAEVVQKKHPPNISLICSGNVLSGLVDRREVISNLETKLAEGRSLIILAGRGGMGKSSSLADWVGRVLQYRPGAMVTITHASRLESEWVANKVKGWSRIPGLTQSNDMDGALRRLRIANHGSAWTLYLIIDGLDESQNDNNGAIKALLQKFIERQNITNHNRSPEVVLIATCRGRKWLKDYLNSTGNSPPQNLDDCFVEVDEFNDEEFLNAINCLPTSDAKSKLLEKVSTGKVLGGSIMSGSIGSGDSFSGLDNEGAMLHFSDRQIHFTVETDPIVALRHPVLWYFFISLSDETKKAFLDMNDIGLTEFAEQLVEWFYEKLKRRRHRAEWEHECIRKFLLKVAQKMESMNSVTTNISVIDAIMKDESIPSNAYTLKGEAASAGLIEEGNDWQWTHPLILKSFIALGKGQARA